MTIDRALDGDPFKIDHFRCRDAAMKLRGFELTPQAEAWSDLPVISQLLFKALFISICQQFNWDFLQNAMATLLLPEPEALLSDLTSIRPSRISLLLSSYPKPERIRSQERARMLRETARRLKVMVEEGQLSHLADSRRLEGTHGFYSLFKQIPAYAEDDLEKKVRVLAHDLHREKIIVFQDPINLRPAIEYHLLRLYIRTGRVYTENAAVRHALLNPEESARPRLVKLFRRAVEEAMNLTAFYADLDVATLNYVEWHIGRSICTPDIPAKCTHPPRDVLPVDVGSLCAGQCAYAAFCRSFTEPGYGWFHEPQFQKAIY